jgi:hypothetical protein
LVIAIAVLLLLLPPPTLPKDLKGVSEIIIRILGGDGRNATKNAVQIGLPAS